MSSSFSSQSLIDLSKEDRLLFFRGTNFRWVTRALFFEQTLPEDRLECTIFTLKDVDHGGYLSLYRLYMEENDPTEYEFANKYLASWPHWLELVKCSWFRPHVQRWREELELQIKASALKEIREEASNSLSKNAFQANKYLLERGWDKDKKETTRSKVGRPTQNSIDERARQMIDEDISFKEDFERLRSIN